MAKKLLSVILAIAMLTAISLGAFAEEPVTITYGLWDANQAALLQQMADEFEAETGIKVKLELNGWGDYWTALEAAATGGSLPDVFWMHTNNIYYYGSNGQLLDLTPYIEKSEKVDLANYPQGLNDIYYINGIQTAIPKDYDTIGLWYNKTMFDEAGLAYPDETWTWDDLYAAAQKLTKEDGSQYGFLAALHGQEGFQNFIYQNGGAVVADRKSGFGSPEAIEAMEYYFKFVRDGLSPVMTDDGARAEAFQNGLVAMAMFGSWNLSAFAANDYVRENCDVTVLPMANNGGKASIYNGLGNAIAWNCPHPDEAWQWVEYLSSKEGQLKAAELGVAISAFNGTSDAWTAAFPMFNAKCYIDMLEYGVIRPYTKQTTVWEDKTNELLSDVYCNGGDVAAVCQQVAEMMDAAIAAEQ